MPDTKSDSAEKYFAWGVSIALIYVLIILPFSALSLISIGPFKRPDELNEFGDFLAGICSPLAFLFFVISVLIQREEFRLAREEMKSSRDELSKQVSQLRLAAMSPILIDGIKKSYLNIELDIDFCVDGLNLYLKKNRKSEFNDDFLKSFEDSISCLDGFNDLAGEKNFYPEGAFKKYCGKDHPNIFYNKLRECFDFANIINKNTSNIKIYFDSVCALKDLYFDAGIFLSDDFSDEMLYVYLEKKYVKTYQEVCFILSNKDCIEDVLIFYRDFLRRMDAFYEIA